MTKGEREGGKEEEEEGDDWEEEEEKGSRREGAEGIAKFNENLSKTFDFCKNI